jgi:hypothetical protein
MVSIVGRITSILLALGIIALLIAQLFAPPREVLLLWYEEQFGHRSSSEEIASAWTQNLALNAHFVFMPAGRREAERLTRAAELRRLTECAAAAPKCTLTAEQYQRMLALLPDTKAEP